MPLDLREPIAVVSVSGGKDSMATAILAIDRFGPERVRLVHADTGNEHELTERYVREYMPARFSMPVEIVKADFAKDIERKRRYILAHWEADGVSPAHVIEALDILQPTGIPFLDLCLLKGRFPSRKGQFCTQELKRRPLDAYMLDRMAEGFVVQSWQGVRRDESEARKDVPDGEWTPEGWWIERPIAAWSAQQTVDFVLSRGFELNPLYGFGCSRVGCMLCINASKDEISNAAKRWPHHIDRLRRWETLVSLASKCGWTTFFCDSFEDGETDAEIFERMNIDARVLWASTKRGGKQYDMLRRYDVPVCASSYGLCE